MVSISEQFIWTSTNEPIPTLQLHETNGGDVKVTLPVSSLSFMSIKICSVLFCSDIYVFIKTTLPPVLETLLQLVIFGCS